MLALAEKLKDPVVQRRLLNGAAIGLLCLFFLPLEFEYDDFFWFRAMDAMHLPVFLFFAIFWEKRLAVRVRSAVARHCCVIALCLFTAFVVEMFQPLVGRRADIQDFSASVFGVFCFYLYPLANNAKLQRYQRALATGAILFLVIITTYPALVSGAGIFRRYWQFPVLGDFESKRELQFWQAQGEKGGRSTNISLDAEQPMNGDYALKVETVEGTWSGVNFRAGQQNWSRYERLNFEIHNPGKAFDINLRVDDSGDCSHLDNRYNRTVRIKPGWNGIQINLEEVARGPKNRELRLDEVRRLLFFTGLRQPATTFYLDAIRLE